MNGEMKGKIGFAERYTAFLDHFKLTPKSLADSLGDAGHVKYNNWKSGKANPNSESLVQIAEKYPVSIDWLLLGIGAMIRGTGSSVESNDMAVEVKQLRIALEKAEGKNEELQTEIREYAKDFRDIAKSNFPESDNQVTDFTRVNRPLPIGYVLKYMMVQLSNTQKKVASAGLAGMEVFCQSVLAGGRLEVADI